MPLHAVEPLRLYRQIAGQIAGLINRGEFPAGAKLPAERELASLLGVSRTSVREAIISLEIAGLVDVRVGTGIFVRDAAPVTSSARTSLSPSDDEPGPFELLSARAVIEGETAALAARHRRDADVPALRATIERMREHADEFAQRDAADREFHERIASMTGNSALTWVVSRLWDQRRGDLWQRIESHFHTASLRAQTIVDHEAIAAAIEARDPELARRAMQRHLSRVAREFRRKIEAAGRAGLPPSDWRRASGAARRTRTAKP